MTARTTVLALLPFTIMDKIEDYPGKSERVDIVSCNTERPVLIVRDVSRTVAEQILKDVNPPEESEEERIERERVEDLNHD